MHLHAVSAAALAAVLACARPAPPPAADSAAASAPVSDATGWRSLFDGRTTAGWRGFRMASMPAGWTVVDGALTRTGEGGDIITTDQFTDFELELEWKVAPGGNSGIMYRVTEDAERTYHTGPEMQVLDDAGHQDGGARLTAAGSAYGLYAAPAGVVKPAGEWNAVRIVMRGRHVEHWLNGVRAVEYELGSPDWEAKVKASKFTEWPGYGRSPRGHIALQDHGDLVAYRNLRIRELP
jgi:hypothetical protein